MSQTLEERCAYKLRELRRKKGYTLHEFEALSGGAIKAVVLGSYERGTRAVSLARLDELSQIYEVPIQYFIGEEQDENSSESGQYIFDLRRIRKMANPPSELEPVKRFLNAIARKRSDWNGEVISLRGSDSQLLSLICELDQSILHEELRLNGFLFASEVSVKRSL